MADKNTNIDVINKGTENYYFLTLKTSIENLKKLVKIVGNSCELK